MESATKNTVVNDTVLIFSAISSQKLSSKERAWNNLNDDGAEFLFLTEQSQEEHSCSTQRLRLFSQEQKDQPECSSYFMHVPKVLNWQERRV